MRRLTPINIIPFTIYNRSAFIQQDHPYLNPKSAEYKTYWMDILNKCIYGFWGYDHNGKEGGWRWMPGNLFFYINITVIEQQSENNSNDILPPILKALDWFKCYGIRVCEGFSGFDEDENYTCDRLIGKLETGQKLKHDERKRLSDPDYNKYVIKKDGTYKKYIDAREYLYKTFDKPKGKPLWKNEAKNWLELGSRGYGKSYYLANGEICYDYVFNGCKSIEDYFNGKTSTTIVVGASESRYSDDILKKFSVTYEYLRTDIGAYKDFTGETTGVFWARSEGGLTSENKIFTNRVPIQGGNGYTGAGSKIYNVTYQKNDNASVGKRARKIIIDEVGTMKNLKRVHQENSAVQKRETKFGQTLMSGTGGDLIAAEVVREFFENPKSFDILEYPDLFGYNNLFTAVFIPCYYRKNIYLDQNGNHNIQEAFEDELLERQQVKGEGTSAYDGHIISYPFYPHEMFLQSKDNLFPTAVLEARLNELEAGEWAKIAKIGTLNYLDDTKTSVKFDIDLTGKYIPLNRVGSERKLDKRGAIVIYEHPLVDKPKPSYTHPLYITVYDPVAKDGDGSSICAVIVFKFWHPKDMSKIQLNIVAEWYGRHSTLDENHEIAWKLANYYGCKVFPEINNADIIRNAKHTRRISILQPKPREVLGQFKQSSSYDYGLLITPGMKESLAMYLNEIYNTIIDKKITHENDGSITENNIIMAAQIPSIRVCEESLQYGPKGNFDAISGMFLVSAIHRNNLEEKKRPVHEDYLKSFKKIFKKKPISSHYHPAFNK